MDYSFFRSEQEEDRLQPILIGILVKNGYGYAATALAKGAIGDRALIADLLRFFQEAGIGGRLRLRTDGEPAIAAVARAVAVARGSENDEPLTIVEESPNKSSASLGSAERWAETLGGLVRTLRADVEERQGVRLRANSRAFSWLVSHAAFVHNRYQVKASGLTPYEDVHQCPYKIGRAHV